jgi:glycosyltransferase involved in cell wall biosynthesis
VAEVINYFVPLDNIIVIHGMLKHIELMTSKKIEIDAGDKIRFGMINVFNNVLKGKKLVLEFFDRIFQTEYADKIEFIVFGSVHEDDKKLLKKYGFVRFHGSYKTDVLNKVLDGWDLHVGIVPSVWEEAYGFVGVEFIAKGIPVIGNNIGGIPEYVIEGKTGWINKSCTSTELYQIIENLVNNPAEIEARNRDILINRNQYIGDMNSNYEKVRRVYKSLLSKDRQAAY